jgi:hypothetical protein
MNSSTANLPVLRPSELLQFPDIGLPGRVVRREEIVQKVLFNLLVAHVLNFAGDRVLPLQLSAGSGELASKDPG